MNNAAGRDSGHLPSISKVRCCARPDIESMLAAVGGVVGYTACYHCDQFATIGTDLGGGLVPEAGRPCGRPGLRLSAWPRLPDGVVWLKAASLEGQLLPTTLGKHFAMCLSIGATCASCSPRSYLMSMLQIWAVQHLIWLQY